MSHPPFAHNPHVYEFVDPDGNPGTGMVVHSQAAGPVEGDADTGAVTPAGEALPDADESPEDDAVDYEAFTKDDLVAECKARGLTTSGNKPDLVKRLQDDDAAKTEE